MQIVSSIKVISSKLGIDYHKICRINDLQYQINRISTVTGTTFDMGNTATTVAFQSRIDSLESMVSSLQTQSTAATSNINALSADQTSICTQVINDP